MKPWQRRVLLGIAGLSILSNCLAPAFAQDFDGRKSVHLFSLNFPPDQIAQYPIPPMQETRFWQLLDREMQATDHLTLTESLEEADYRVELNCSGIFNCSELAVDIKDAQRNLLTSFTLKHIAPFWGLGKPNLDKISRQLAIRLDERIKQLGQGGYGYMK